MVNFLVSSGTLPASERQGNRARDKLTDRDLCMLRLSVPRICRATGVGGEMG